jgi:hypothetical protein
MATSIEQLKQAKATWEFKAPSFANGVELVVELREPSLAAMMYEDGIANPLLNDVQTLTEQAKSKKKSQPSPAQQASAYRFMRSVVDYCMVTPTMKDIEDYAGGLSDTQLIAIYQEIMKSTSDLSSFRN